MTTANENPARACVGQGRGLGNPHVRVFGATVGGLRFANSRRVPKVPHGTSCSLLTRHQAQAAAVLDHSRALPQGDGGARPAFAGGDARTRKRLSWKSPPCALGSALARWGGRVFGADSRSLSFVHQVPSNGEEHEEDSDHGPNIDAGH